MWRRGTDMSTERPPERAQHRSSQSEGTPVRQFVGNTDDFGMDTISLAGPLEAQLRAIREAGFTQVMLACSSTSVHASGDTGALVRDLRKLAMLAIPMNIKVAYEALSWGRTVNEFPQAWEIVSQADMPNLGLGFDSFHMFATRTPLDDLELVDPSKIFLVQLADFMWNEIKSVEERITTARHFRLFPGEGVHSQEVAALTLKLHQMGYRGDYSFEVFNDDYQAMPLDTVARRARQSPPWLGESVLRRSVPLPNQMRLRR